MTQKKGAKQRKVLEETSVTLSTGVILKTKPAPIGVILDALAELQKPKTPTFLDSYGDVQDNPLDPEYQEGLGVVDAVAAARVMNTFIGRATEAVEPLPDDIPHWHTDEWWQEMEVDGTEVKPHLPYWRYLTWVKVVAAPTSDDITAIFSMATKSLGVREETVANVGDNFPGSEEE